MTAAPATFDCVQYHSALLERRDDIPIPVATIATLSELVRTSETTTTTAELLALVKSAGSELEAASFSPVSVAGGVELFLRFCILQRPPPEMSFADVKRDLVEKAERFVLESSVCRQLVASFVGDFVNEGAVILVHGYSRTVVQALLHAQAEQKHFRVYATESRPLGLGVKTQAVLGAAGIECIVVLDSAVGYIMPKVDMCLVGAEAVCESGGLINYIGGHQIALVAKAYRKPLYALAESYKFTRLFPISQYDFPESLSHRTPLEFGSRTDPSEIEIPRTPARPMVNSKMPSPLQMADEMVRQNPLLDYTTPDLVQLIISDLGPMMPSAVSDALLSMYGGE